MDISNIVESLKRCFGTGTNPKVRLELYQRIAAVVSNDDTGRAERCVASVVSDARKANDPGRYFAHVVVNRLEERGFAVRPQIALDQVFGDYAN